MTAAAFAPPPAPQCGRIAILVGAGRVTALSWVCLVVMALGMRDMPMDDMAMDERP